MDKETFVKSVLSASKLSYNNFVIDDYDCDRVYLHIDGKEYNIRTWDIDSKGIRYTLFEIVGDHGEEVCNGYYPFPKS